MTKQIPLHGKYGEGKFALVDDADFEWLSQYRWRGMKAARTVYAVATIDRRPVLMHRMIMDAPKKMTVDHIDHCGFNNQRGNLRLATNAENSRNRSTVIGKSQCRGVFWSTARRLWMAAIKITNRLSQNSDVLTAGLISMFFLLIVVAFVEWP